MNACFDAVEAAQPMLKSTVETMRGMRITMAAQCKQMTEQFAAQMPKLKACRASP
jgi:hypothetical protein